MSQIVVERFTPDLEIYAKRRAPETDPWAVNVFADKALQSTQAWPGVRHNVRFLELDNRALFNQDALPGQSVFRPRVLMLENTLAFRDAGANKYDVIETTASIMERMAVRESYEESLKQIAQRDPETFTEPEKARYDLLTAKDPAFLTQAELNELAALLYKNPSNFTDEEKRTMAGIKDIMARLMDGGNDFGDGFLITYPDLYDTKAEGVIWEMALPIPIDLIHKDKLREDGALTLRILRASTLEEQGEDHNLIFKLTNGSTCYALVFGRNNSVQWWHYRNMKASKRADLEAEAEVIKDKGRLTVADSEQIRQWKNQIEDIKDAAKLEGRSGAELSESEKAQIKSLDTQTDELKKKKQGLSAADESRLSDINKKLFYDQQNVNLQEDTKSLFERVFDVTIRFLRKGQVTIQLDKNAPWTWTNGAIAKLRKYTTMLPKDCRLVVHSDGGAFGFAVGRPDYKRHGILATGIFEPGFEIDPANIRFDFDADFVSSTYDADGTFTGVTPFGARVVAKCVVVQKARKLGGIKKPPRYQLRLEFFSDEDGIYTPEVHLLHFRILAGGVPGRGDVVYQTLPSKDAGADQPVKDIQTQDGLGSGASYVVHIDNKVAQESAKGLPIDLVGREVVLKLMEVSTNNVHELLIPGFIKRADHVKISLLERVLNLLRFKRDSTSEIHIATVGLEEILNRPIRFPIHGNGKYPNDYIREVCQNAGLRAGEYAGVLAGDIGIPKTQPPAAGQAPDIAPELGVRFWEHLTDFVAKHCRGYRLVLRATGLVLESDVYRDRPDLDYRSTRASWDPLHIKRGFSVYEDWSEYFTEATITGAVDPQTGKRWAAMVTRPEALNPRFEGSSLYHTGTPLVHFAPIDDALTTYEDCAKCARQFKARYMLPPWYVAFDAPFNGSIRTGDVIRVDTLKAVVENIQRANLYAGRGVVPKMSITARFTEDILIGLEKET